jgi:hypothetical protein
MYGVCRVQKERYRATVRVLAHNSLAALRAYSRFDAGSATRVEGSLLVSIRSAHAEGLLDVPAGAIALP